MALGENAFDTPGLVSSFREIVGHKDVSAIRVVNKNSSTINLTSPLTESNLPQRSDHKFLTGQVTVSSQAPGRSLL